MADTVDLKLRPDMISSPRFRVACVYCAGLDSIIMIEREAYDEAPKHIDNWPGHSVFIHPVTLVQKWNDEDKS